MIQVIFFDYGGTYARGQVSLFIQKACGLLHLPFEQCKHNEVIFVPELNKGHMSVEDAFRKFFQVSINDRQMKELLNLWTSNWIPDLPMIELVKKLKKNYHCAILSNSDPANVENCKARGYFDDFQTLILSHELGVIKPDPKIYEIALERVHAKGENCLFIDDQEVCLAGARPFGIRTIKFRSVEELKKEFALLSIKFEGLD
jgi:HAD superfamily hydrolase (TIGR01509 family)